MNGAVVRSSQYATHIASVWLLSLAATTLAAEYHVARQAENASDDNPGTETEPWVTISRAASATGLRPGDTVVIHSGTYREHVDIQVSGDSGQPITFAAAPGERVVLKGSELVTGPWTRLSAETTGKEPYPHAFADVWQVQLGDEFFTDARFAASYSNKERRWVSQVFVSENLPLQKIGPDRIYTNEESLRLPVVGRDLEDIIPNSFYFDPSTQTLYVKVSGSPTWYNIEVGVRGFALTAEDIHDVVIRGLEIRQNRQPGGQWPMVAISKCERVVVEGCKIAQADFCGLGLGRSKDCTLRNCDLSYNGNTGFGMSLCESCVIEDCTLMFNNYRRFHQGWHAGGMKCIPGNQNCTVRGCEVAYNIASDGLWFDYDNAGIRILGNVCHHNDGCGIFFEINKGGGVIADNLVYANRGRGIYLSGSQKTWVVHNTVAFNHGGIVCMPRGDDWPLEDVHVLNNLLIRNTLATTGFQRGADLTLFMGADDGGSASRTVTANHSDYNVFATSDPAPTMRHSWNPDNLLARWRERFGEDLHSRISRIQTEVRGTSFAVRNEDTLNMPGPLPESLNGIVSKRRQVGCSIHSWPCSARP